MSAAPGTIEWYRQDARNILWAVAFLGFIPLLIVVILCASGQMKAADFAKGALVCLGISLPISAPAIIAGVLCAKGRKAGRALGHLPALLVILNVPLGTIFGIGALVKLNKRPLADSLT